jgi:hypothetical protein
MPANPDYSDLFRIFNEEQYGGIPVRILGKAELITTKKACGRKTDLLDVERLEQSRD